MSKGAFAYKDKVPPGFESTPSVSTGDEGTISKESSFLSATSEVPPTPTLVATGSLEAEPSVSGFSSPSEESESRAKKLDSFTSGSPTVSSSTSSVATQTPPSKQGDKVKNLSPKRGEKVRKALFTEQIRKSLNAGAKLINSGDDAIMKSFSRRQSRGLSRRHASPSTSDSSSPHSLSDSKGKCPLHESSAAFGAAMRKNPGQTPRLPCTCSPEERRVALMCVSCQSVPCMCDAHRRSTSSPAPTMVTRQGGRPLGHFDKETHAFSKNE